MAQFVKYVPCIFVLEGNQYKTMEFRPKNYRPKRMGLYNQKRVVVPGIPEYLLFQKCKTNKFKYVSAEIGSAILSYRWFIEGGGADQIRSLDSNYGFFLVKLY